MVPLPLPEEGDMVHQAWLLVAVHAAVLVTAKLVEPADADTGRSEGVTVGQDTPCWVTVTLIGLHPGTVTVMVATLALPVAFAVYVAIMVPFPVPEEGAIVHQA